MIMVINFNPFSVFVGMTLACLTILVLSIIIYLSKKRPRDIPNKLFIYIFFAVIVEVVLEFGCHLAVQNLSADYLLWIFVMKLYIVFVFIATVLMTLYVTAIDQTISAEKRRQQMKNRGISLTILTIAFITFMFLTKLDTFYDGFYGYSYSPLITYFMIPVVCIMAISWLRIVIRNWRIPDNTNRRRFAPVIIFILLYIVVAIVQGLVGRWLLLTTITHTIIIIIMVNTVENPEAKILGVLTTTKEKMERLGKAKDEFMSIASHQLRTPITTIEGYSDMLARGDFGKLTKEQEKAVRQINRSATNMSSSIKDFLDISRIQTGRFILNKTNVNIKKIVEKRIGQLQTLADEKNIDMVVHYGKKLPSKILVDEDKISQVAMNFIDNAIYYTHPGHKVTVDLVAYDQQLVFTVEDEGIGVPAGEQTKLFGKFYRASNARTTRPDGTGIGLFLAKKIVTAHGGSIIFSSIEGKGSVFGFSLPLDKLK